MTVQRSRRRPLRVPVSVRVAGHKTELFARAFTSSLSDAGMSLIGVLRDTGTAPQIEVGTTVQLRFALPGQASLLSPTAHVLHIDQEVSAGALGLSLKLTRSVAEIELAITSFLAEQRAVVLALDDDTATLTLLNKVLSQNHEVLTAASAADAMAYLEREDVAVLVLDHCMPGTDGVAFIEELNRRYPGRTITKIVHSAHLEPAVIEAYINTAKVFHYLRKPVGIAELASVVDAAVETRALIVDNTLLSAELLRANERLEDENSRLRAMVDHGEEFERIIGRSRALRDAIKMLWQVADFPTNVNLHGETGTGKELAARTIHRASSRRPGPFLAFNCAGVPDSLVQSTLFGHCRGAFTGAEEDRTGLFEEGNGGTVFLDEVGELSQAAQTSLLRVLQEGEVVPLGATKPRKVDVRIISATHRNLRADVEAGRFREDLYYRLVVYEIEIAPLRERPEDVAPLAEHFLKRICRRFGKTVLGFAPEALECLERYHWPGNVRELSNEIERAVIQATPGGVVTSSHLSSAVRQRDERTPYDLGRFAELPLRDAMQQLEARLIDQAMRASDHVAARAAKRLGIDASNLRKKLKKLSREPDAE